MKSSFLFILFLLSAGILNAQSSLSDSIKAQLIKDWEFAKILTNKYLDIMPDEKYNFKPQDGMRAFSQEMLHLAQVNNAMVSNGTGVCRIFSRESVTGWSFERYSVTADYMTVLIPMGPTHATKGTRRKPMHQCNKENQVVSD